MPQDVECHKSDISAPEKSIIGLVALGSNQPSRAGSPLKTVRDALVAISDSGLKIIKTSRFFSTPCFPAGAGPDYVNATVAVQGADSASALLGRLHDIEADYGRERNQRWGQRTLDLDLIGFGDEISPDFETYEAWRDLPSNAQRQLSPNQLILPHPRLQDRAFVLVPLAEIAPGWVHPVSQRTVQQMMDALPEAEKKGVTPL